MLRQPDEWIGQSKLEPLDECRLLNLVALGLNQIQLDRWLTDKQASLGNWLVGLSAKFSVQSLGKL